MPKKLTVTPENCSGCKMCEKVCAIMPFGVNNPKKSAVRAPVTYPHRVVRMTEGPEYKSCAMLDSNLGIEPSRTVQTTMPSRFTHSNASRSIRKQA